MRQFEEQTKKVKEVTSIVCNKCGRVIPVIEGVPQEDVLLHCSLFITLYLFVLSVTPIL